MFPRTVALSLLKRSIGPFLKKELEIEHVDEFSITEGSLLLKDLELSAEARARHAPLTVTANSCSGFECCARRCRGKMGREECICAAAPYGIPVAFVGERRRKP